MKISTIFFRDETESFYCMSDGKPYHMSVSNGSRMLIPASSIPSDAMLWSLGEEAAWRNVKTN